MKAICDSGIPMDFKGATALKACLTDAGFTDRIRRTTDIDANRYSDTPPAAEKMEETLSAAHQRNGIALNDRLYGKSRSAGFELSDPDRDEILFTMDSDVNRPVQSAQIHDAAGFQQYPVRQTPQ